MDGRDKTEPNGVDEHAAEMPQDVAAVEPELETGAEAGPEAGSEAGQAAEETPEADRQNDPAHLKDQLFRALADAENARRRAKKDVEDARRYANTNFARDLLAVADNMSRALGTISAEARAADTVLNALAEGIEMTARELDSAFTRHGIKRVDPMGDKFDYNQHQAMFETANTDQPDGTVVEVAQVGYVLGDRLLRPAMVGIAKGGKPAPKPSAAPSAAPSTAPRAAPGAAQAADGGPEADDSDPERGEHVDTSA